jgi:hypothetical protein
MVNIRYLNRIYIRFETYPGLKFHCQSLLGFEFPRLINFKAMFNDRDKSRAYGLP